METQLKLWINDYKIWNHHLPSPAKIKSKAQELCRFKDKFKASKGWFEKFVQRHFPNETFTAAHEKKDQLSFKFATPQRDFNFSIERPNENDSFLAMTIEQRLRNEVTEYNGNAQNTTEKHEDTRSSRRRLIY
jgi:hypothetical protein